MKSIVVGTAGHIDHGKSALVQALTGTDPDRLKEEKARGITIDLGFANLTVGDSHFAFVDVPGHERFVKNMLAGVGGIDLVVLVVAADESVMPQTREHFDICRLLRVPAGIVALTKADIVDADTIAIVKMEVRELVAGSFPDGAPMLPVSSRTGAGLDSLRDALVAATRAAGQRSAAGAARLPIDRVFSMKGFGTVVTGTLVSGRVRPDDELIVQPGDRAVKVRGLQVHGAQCHEAAAGTRTAVNLSGVELADITRGQSLVSADRFEVTRLADAALELLPTAKPLKHGARVRFHQGTAEILGRVAIVGPLPAHAGRSVPSISPGSRSFARLRLEAPAVLTRGDRFILRAYSPPMTIAGGHILDPRPPRRAIRTAAAEERLRSLDFDPADAGAVREATARAIAVMAADSGDPGLTLHAVASRAGVAPPEVEPIVATLVGAGRVVRVGDVLMDPRIIKRLEAGVIELLADHHRTQPLSEGAAREEVRERLFAHGSVAAFERVIDDLTKAGRIGGRQKLALASHRVALSAEEEQARTAIERILQQAGLTPPDPAAVAASAGVTPAVADRVMSLLHRQKVLVKVGTLVFHEDALKMLKEEVTKLKAADRSAARIDVATFKERFGVTRKFAIPLLEYLDRERVTRRVGDARVII